ncbi:carboxylating nicotinate-nucleotide diphosphorylase [Thiorhodococcus mannitoliphagus]|uniref:Probable nicotinate-nucleotide pyrophosphorylase [carboxylating] n=1 Tax=Thiorhodococcus mannitoliphagus TaxID=329406 RepID=A0A6P1DNS0_9GAMM|nr:carboxylating nicotinate-nucleotide diphosphorylase [Thiorhodococcus mannitoliphagus]NEX18843.1 carboxylating nicotinate-nucleotide diphosphorylase [Thiorhodococcus mannitoliphagus]
MYTFDSTQSSIQTDLKAALPPAEVIAAQVSAALAEDLGDGDLTAQLLPVGQRSRAELITREDAVLAGCAWAEAVCYALDPDARIRWEACDGEPVAAGQRLCVIEGRSRALLSAERTAMNYLQTLSGTATRARRYADAVAGLPVEVLDTRKTLPGLRLQQKYAVLCGGCHNHRQGLFDAILIKENHILAAGSIPAALQAAREIGGGVPVEIEVESLAELKTALDAGARVVLLDNFSLERLREAVAANAGRARLEASGGVTLETIRPIAETGVDRISVGDLTKDVIAVDLSMRFVVV